MKLLDGKVAIITGGSRGIGRAICLAFAEAGATVIFTYFGSVEKANEVCVQIEQFGVKALAIQSDASSFTAAQEVVDSVFKSFGKIDIMINNAGITQDNLLLRMTEEQWDKVIDNNLKSVFNYTKSVSKYFLKQKSGVFLNIGSVVGISGNGGQANYAASKGGMIAFTKSVAKELGSRSIRANVIAPGFIHTEMTENLPEEELKRWMADIPLGRGGSVKDVADVCVFMASDKAAYLTGQVIQVDGGMLMG